MLALALTLVAASPSAASLAASGGLRGSLVLVDVAAGVEAQAPLGQMTREQLRVEYRRVEESRPGIAGQITATALGGATIAAGVLTLYGTLLFSLGRSVPAVGLAVGFGLLLGGGALLTFGIVMLRLALAERRPYNEAMDEIQERIDGVWDENHGLQPLPPPAPYDPAVPPAPPPPPPPSAIGLPPLPPMVMVARF